VGEYLGNLLKEKRLKKNLSLDEVSESLLIRRSYIEAIEEGDGKVFLNSFYCQGFTKQYAEFLGLDDSLLLNGQEEPKRASPPFIENHLPFFTPLGVRKDSMDRGTSPLVIWPALLLALFLLIKIFKQM